MTQKIKLDYYESALILSNIKLNNSLEYCHGLLVGLICSKKQIDIKHWLVEIVDNTSTKLLADNEIASTFASIFKSTNEEISYSLNLLIKPDSDSLSQQMSSLKQWCTGFLNNLNTKAITIEEDKKIIDEIIKDIKIICLSEDKITQNEDNERDYTEIISYVSICAGLVFETIRSSQLQNNN